MTRIFVNGKQVTQEELSQYVITNERIIRILLEAGEPKQEKGAVSLTNEIREAAASEGT